MKIYVVTSGDYSDYSIEAVCTSMESAKRIVSMVDNRWDEPRIEIYEADKRMHDPAVSILVKMDGESVVAYDETLPNHKRNEVVKENGVYKVEVFSSDYQRAKKIGVDLIMQYKAMEEGL